jgi:dTDP-L-rhamnose 4-epimerase
VRVLDNLSEQIHGRDPRRTSPLLASLDPRVDVHVGTVTSRDDWQRALQDQDVVVHLAAETGTGQSMYQVERYVDVNVRGTSILLDLIANNATGIRKVVVASSRAIYGEGKYLSPELGPVYPESRLDADLAAGRFEPTFPRSGPLRLVPTDEESKIHPASVYGVTKQVQEQLVMNVCGARGVAAVGFRYQNVYGPGQSLSNPYTGILSIFSNRILAGQPLNVFEDGLESRDFVYVSDVVEATVAGVESQAADGLVFNVGSGRATSVLELARRLVALYGADVPIEVSGLYRLGDIRHNVADLTRLRERLGIEPKVGLDEGLAEFVRWVRGQQVDPGDYEKSLAEMRERGLLKSA